MALKAVAAPLGSPVGGSGTLNYVAKWTSTGSTLGNSVAFDNGTTFALDTNSPLATPKFQVGASGSLANYQGAPVGIILPTGSGSWLELCENSGSGTTFRISKDSTTGVVLNANGKHLGFNANGYITAISSCQMVMLTNGNVGIGTASPNKKLQVVDGASGEVRFTTTANVAGNTITQRFSSNAAAGAYEGGGAYIQAIQGAGIDIWSLAFGTANVSATSSEQMRITSTGSVGIGTASPASRLHVKDATNRNMIMTSGTTGMKMTSITDAGAEADVGVQGNTVQLLTGATERMRIDSSGNVVLNTASTGATIQAAGSQQGLKLPSTPGNADTQTLDCYQENTWAPTLAGFGGTAPTVNSASYTRIGRLVYFNIFLVATGGASYSGTRTTTTISLPFQTAGGQALVNMMDANVNALGSGLIATNSGGVIFLPTFALTTTNTFISGWYQV